MSKKKSETKKGCTHKLIEKSFDSDSPQHLFEFTPVINSMCLVWDKSQCFPNRTCFFIGSFGCTWNMSTNIFMTKKKNNPESSLDEGRGKEQFSHCERFVKLFCKVEKVNIGKLREKLLPTTEFNKLIIGWKLNLHILKFWQTNWY